MVARTFRSPVPRAARRVSGAARAAGSDVFSRRRLLLAVKTAVAAAVAWYLAPAVPFAEAEYSYYAPLGVLISMYPTIVDSARAGLLTLVGLAGGIALGFGGLGLVALGAPGVVALALVVGAGVALGGIRALGEGRDWISFAGLFVLLLGGRDADGFSTSYLVTMAFGVLVGVITNLLIAPPLYVRAAGDRMSALRDRIVAALAAAADSEAERLPTDRAELAALADAVAGDVREAERSRRANPRARRSAVAGSSTAERWAALERIAALTRDVLDSVAERPELRDERLSEALGRVADLVAVSSSDPAAAARGREATDAVRRYAGSLGPVRDGVPGGWAVATDLDRIVATCIRLVEAPSGR